MDDQSKAVLEVLDMLGSHHEKLIDRALALRRTDHVRDLKHEVDVRLYQSGLSVEAYLDVELSDGTARCWSLEISPTGRSWRVDATVTDQSTAGRQEVVRDWTFDPMEDYSRFRATLGEASRTLLADLDEWIMQDPRQLRSRAV